MLFKKLTPAINKIPSAWRWALILWISGRIMLSVWGYFVWTSSFVPPIQQNYFYYHVQPVLESGRGAWLGVWQRWDGVHYQQIAENGYHDIQESSAFFPLYPLLARGISFATSINSLVCLLLISNLSLLLLLVEFYQMLESDFSTRTARAATAALVLFPTAFFFYAAYPHSLALLLTLLTYRWARTRRWLAASVAGIFAGLAHSTIVPLAIMLGWEVLLFLKTQHRKIDFLSLLVPFTPLMGVALFLAWRIQQGFPSFSGLMASIWGRMVQPPWQTLIDIVSQFHNGPVYASMLYDVPLLLLAVFLLVWGWKKLPLSQNLYTASLLVYLLSNSIQGQPLASFSRYLLIAFPLFTALGLVTERKGLRLAAVTMGLTAQVLLSAVFFLWGWVD